ncbi:MAG: UDP-N-acetylmuramoyl-L-alanyl-D-glutamate--2,6-diaminopimelate ligase [Tatlockia sp.]|nr:UDP-N-acetylmuramoyl-L-alanyl-D-glutamate--2,6-diaminopimelate ligase [Tatlockia sp.]
MKLAELLHPWINIDLPICDISGLNNDSRQIKPGYLFIAYPGAASDGRSFIDKALAAGASALIYEPDNLPTSFNLPANIPAIALPGLSTKLASLASRFYGEPSKKLAVTGVTGTNGKTTIAYQLAQGYSLLGERSAYIGTIGQGEVHSLKTLANTTPDGLCLQQLLYSYEQQEIKQLCMEVSSHALTQHRVDCIDFTQAIFTNLSHDHLDYHQTMDAYAAAKALLFSKESLKWAIVNKDDNYSQLMSKASRAEKIISYGIKEGADVLALNWDVSLLGTRLELNSPWGNHELIINALGFFNIYNSLAIFTSLLASGYSAEKVIPIMAKLKAAPGRMEIVAHEPYAIVDYAHSPDALENVLSTLKKVKKGRILLVFGCGGDRDKTKRPVMGKIASLYADVSIITSDNPRNEDPLTIIDEIEAGFCSKSNLFKIPDRKQAIAKALSLADKNDIVLVAGKGHENYQQIGSVRNAFSDQEVIRQLQKTADFN